MSEELSAYQKHLREIDIPLWEYRSSNGADWFTIQLFSLFGKADDNNRRRLALGFPEEHEAWLWWFHGKDGEE